MIFLQRNFCLYPAASERRGFVYNNIMGHRTKILLTSLLVFTFSFLSFLPTILRNTVPFHTDEMYWIQTARILPYMLETKFHDSYWREHMGFTNFNGAKWLYAFGLRLLGHTDFSSIGNPPFHYEKWKAYDGTPFPINHQLYPLLLHGRLISVFSTSVGMSFMFLFVLMTVSNYPAAILAVILLRVHPVTVNIATHAFADGLFLTLELFTFTLVVRMLRSHVLLESRTFVLLGAILGYGVATKINAFMFYILVLIDIVLWSILHGIPKRQLFRAFLVITLVAQFTFLIVHPNFYFFPQYSPLQMIADRVEITRYHMAYFFSIYPDHVLFTVPQRFNSLWRHVFTPILLPLFVAGFIESIYLCIKRENWTKSSVFFMQWINLYIVSLFLLAYVAFDEQRYFLPLLPFICLIAVSWIQVLAAYISSLGRYWRASAK